MGGLEDYYQKFVKSVGDVGSTILDYGGKAASYLSPSAAPVIKKATSDASQWMKNEISNKADLRTAQILGFGSGFPILGGLINGWQGAVQMEDLYNNTGKVPAYPGLQSLGTGGIGSAVSQAMRIADGSNDLYRYYAGEPDQWSISMYG